MESRIINQTNTTQKKLALFIDQIIRARFWIAIAVFIFMLVFKLHGSSLNMWDTYVSDKTGDNSGLIAGKPRAVRSDEWLVQTPFSLSQTQTGLKQHNEVITIDGQDMIVGYNSAAIDVATIAKPFSWGYVLLGKEYGLSWVWGIKLIGMILFSFEIGLILTKRNKYLALLASLWIPFSSAIQWWFVSPVGDLIFFTLGFLVGIYNYFYYHKSKGRRLFFSLLATISISGFVLVLYPALQVPLGYLILILLIGFFFEFYKKVKLDKFDALFIGGAITATCLIIGISIYSSWESLLLVMNTVYPGKRVSVGGDFPRKDILLFLTNWKMPFMDVTYTNSSELSSFYHLFFVFLPMAPIIFFKKIRENLYGFLLFFYCVFSLLWMSFSFPSILAKITLWSYVPSVRVIVSFGFASVLLSLWFIQYLWEKESFKSLLIGSVLFFNLALYFFALYTGNLRLYISKWAIIVILLLAAFLIIALFKKWKVSFCFVLAGIVLITGTPVNPLAQGVAPVYEKKIAHEIQQIEKKDPGQLWAGERLMYGYLPMLGVHTFNGIAFTPNLDSWKILDPDKKNEDVYNRYAHINVEITNNEPTLQLLQSDAIVARLNPQVIKEYGIKYLITYKEIQDLSTSDVRFVQLYGPDKDGAFIYKARY
ncbi:hypothetical protein A5866_003054 [Enterococcus sp. 12C11_DIV0727]|uniref:Glycosyltransferase RgtA/B/C/D-like domain-containing protein n=2 Tax=Candidatus Enterococcus lemimoniae TaxID=1834167 RepID=A0ABZ2TAI9_9ENTE|nr:hypothetical protein [Enterococcus sp. 12C11_DIV0727]OTO70162.1 hypothetical protein A5866_002382 [Enterococcus sp. 12C11_DIV0727]